MDSLTQIVLGAAVGEASLGKKVGNKALLYGAIAGTIPDLDVISNYFTDTITAIEWHRGFSHSVLFCILFAPLLGWLVSKMEHKRGVGWKPWSMLFFWCLFTHPLLDAFTTWGTQLFWPFETRLAFNSIFVIDPLYTFPFLVLTIMVLFYRRDSITRKRLNRTGLILSTSYLLIAMLVKQVVNQKFEKALEEQEITYRQISSRPSPMNIVLWNANVETDESYLLGDYSLFDSSPIRFVEYSKNREASREFMGYENVQRLIKIAEGWYILQEKEGSWFFNDLRFGLIPKKNGDPYFAFSYKLLMEHGKVRAEEVSKTRVDGEYLIKSLWERIQGR